MYHETPGIARLRRLARRYSNFSSTVTILAYHRANRFDIADVGPVIASAVFHPEVFNQTFNVGSDRHYSVNQVARAVFSAMAEYRHSPPTDAQETEAQL